MSQSVWGYWLIALGIGVLTLMMLVQNYTTVNQEDYYLLKEVTQASMMDAIDYNHYRQYGEVKINKEKFIENFERRFAESVKGNKNYQTDFYSIYETPPKVSVKVTTKTNSFNISGEATELDVTNSIDAILENNSTRTITKIFYSVPYGPCNSEDQDALGYCTVTNSPALWKTGIKQNIVKELQKSGINVDESKLKIVSSRFVGLMTTDEDFEAYNKQYEATYGVRPDQVEHHSPSTSDLGVPIDTLLANELIDIKLTVTNDDVLAWTGKFKCDGKTHGYPRGTKDSGDAAGNNKNDISGSCLLGIKYELKFSYR